jgi:prepilin-type N-terminal cleavage/methylation domain-containing protein
MQVAEPGLQRMASRATPTPTDIATRRRAGFTLMELMIVVVMVAVLALAVAPSMTEVLANNRQTSASMDLIRFARRIRQTAISSGTAHLMHYVQTASNGLGRIQVYRGMNNRCMQTPWNVAMDPGNPQLGPNRNMSFDMIDYNPSDVGSRPGAADSGRQVIGLLEAGAGNRTELSLCYQPDGMVYAIYGDMTVTMVMQNVDTVFRIVRKIEGVEHGRAREVIFPLGGQARFR